MRLARQKKRAGLARGQQPAERPQPTQPPTQQSTNNHHHIIPTTALNQPTQPIRARPRSSRTSRPRATTARRRSRRRRASCPLRRTSSRSTSATCSRWCTTSTRARRRSCSASGASWCGFFQTRLALTPRTAPARAGVAAWGADGLVAGSLTRSRAALNAGRTQQPATPPPATPSATANTPYQCETARAHPADRGAPAGDLGGARPAVGRRRAHVVQGLGGVPAAAHEAVGAALPHDRAVSSGWGWIWVDGWMGRWVDGHVGGVEWREEGKEGFERGGRAQRDQHTQPTTTTTTTTTTHHHRNTPKQQTKHRHHHPQ